ncbi:MAG: alpha/beta hydrolase [Gammaproteobacteria bacterium]|nr:MAG: alpha/beta hydrolase [Gammaproteobacteria bacterium]
MYSFIKTGIILLLLNTTVVWASTAMNYGYPLENPYAATILGTPNDFKAELPRYNRIPSKEYTLEIPDTRTIPDVFWYHRQGLNYAVTAQNKKAPLIFAIAGTGAGHRSAKMKLFQRAFYQAGYHVITISSPTFTNFMVNASKTAIPGNLEEDSADLYNVMQQIMNEHSELEVTDYNLIGYSLGASQAAFVARLDEQKKAIGFNKVLMINPPLNLFHSVKLLDNMLTANIPGGVDNFNAFFKNFMKNITAYYREHQKLSLTGPDFFYAAYKDKNPNDSKMQALIGIAFRMSSSDMMFVSDVFNNLGYLVPKNTPLETTTSLTRYSKASRRLGFSDYVEEIYLPYFSKATGSSHDELIAQSSLLSIKDYLQQSDNIGLMHNENDPILMKGEIDTIKSLFPGRAMVYPYGGHCGNMEYKDNVAYMVNFFSGSEFSGSNK